jgi:ABC-type branched-subunit amino acid transport system substrate-binding protein
MTNAEAETVKVGVLHSLSGTMAISETSLKDALLFTFDEINKAGGIKTGGKNYLIEPVVVDPHPTGRCSPRRRAVAGQGQGRRRVRLLDFREPQVVSPGV